MEKSPLSLSVENLTVARGGLPVLEAVNFTLHAGQALVLRGPNGIGKTTLLRTIAGLQPALQGTIGLDRDMIAYAAHKDGLKDTLTVEENLEFWAQAFGSQDMTTALKVFDLGKLRARPAGALSAGQRRRLGLARLVLVDRPVWILDEPTVSLDAPSVAMFARVVHAHLRQGGMALMASHIDLGVQEADVLELAPYKASSKLTDSFDEAFL